MEEEDRLKWIYSSRDNQELSARYDQWATDYDVELGQGYGWQADFRTTEEQCHRGRVTVRSR